MKKEIGKWLLDVAKYVTTAVILSSVFSNMEKNITVYIFGCIFVAILVIAGLLLLKEEKNINTKNKRR